MDSLDERFYSDLTKEDDVGLILRGHLHIEHELMTLVCAVLPFGERCDFGKISYSAKIEIAYACGLPLDVKELLNKIGSLRNDFAHKLNAEITKDSALNLFNSLSERHRIALKGSYKVMTSNSFTSPSNLEPRDLLTLILLNAHSSIRAAVFAVKQKQ